MNTLIKFKVGTIKYVLTEHEFNLKLKFILIEFLKFAKRMSWFKL